MNKLIVVGRLTKDPVIKGQENKVAVFTVAVNRNFTNAQGEREADFIQIKAFKKLADNCIKYLNKGSLVSVEASVRTGSYQKDGKTEYTIDFFAESIQFLGGKKNVDRNVDNGGNQYNNSPFGYEDDPFNGNVPVPEGWPFG